MTVRKIENITVKSHAMGIVADKPRKAYDGVVYLNPSSIAAGLIDHRTIDPASIKYAFENPGSGPGTAAAIDRMDRGTLAHMMLLQPERVAKDTAIWTGAKRGGAEWDNFSMLNADKLIIREQDYDAVSLAVKAFQFEPRVRQLLTNLDAEVAMFSREHTFYVKGLVDAVTRGDLCHIIDLKTTEAGFSPREIESTIRRFRNREKMAAYRRWIARGSGRDPEMIKCHNLFLSMVPPYAVIDVPMTTMALEWGEARIVAALDAVQRQLDANDWPMFYREHPMMVDEWERTDDEIPLEGFDDE